MTANFVKGELVQWVNSDGQLCIDQIRQTWTGALFFWNNGFSVDDYPGLEKLDVSVPYFDNDVDFVND